MAERPDRQIAVKLAFSEKVWDALTADLKDFWRDCLDDATAPDMALSERVNQFVHEHVAQWLSWLPAELRSDDLDDGVPF